MVGYGFLRLGQKCLRTVLGPIPEDSFWTNSWVHYSGLDKYNHLIIYINILIPHSVISY